MTVARTVAGVLDEPVVFEVECIDRMYCNVYVPQLQHAGGLLGFVQRHLGLPVASTAPLAKITDRFTREVHRFADPAASYGSCSRAASARSRSAASPRRTAVDRPRPRCS